MDVALSAAAGLKVVSHEKAAEEMPLGWVLDRIGNPTTDPSQFLEGGSLVTVGEHNGCGFAVPVECLTGVLASAGIMSEVVSCASQHKIVKQPGPDVHCR